MIARGRLMHIGAFVFLRSICAHYRRRAIFREDRDFSVPRKIMGDRARDNRASKIGKINARNTWQERIRALRSPVN